MILSKIILIGYEGLNEFLLCEIVGVNSHPNLI